MIKTQAEWDEGIKIARRAIYKFKGIINSSDLEECIHNALVYSVMNYNPNKKASFSTFVINNTKFICMKFLRKKAGYAKKLERYKEYLTFSLPPTGGNDVITEKIYDSLVLKLNMKEISKKFNVSKKEIEYDLKKNKKLFIVMMECEKYFNSVVS